jgi:hypothetical protein
MHTTPTTPPGAPTGEPDVAGALDAPRATQSPANADLFPPLNPQLRNMRIPRTTTTTVTPANATGNTPPAPTTELTPTAPTTPAPSNENTTASAPANTNTVPPTASAPANTNTILPAASLPIASSGPTAPPIPPTNSTANAPSAIPNAVVPPMIQNLPAPIPINPNIQYTSLPQTFTRIQGVTRHSLTDISTTHWAILDTLADTKLILILYDGAKGINYYEITQTLSTNITTLTGRVPQISIIKNDMPIFIAAGLDNTAAAHLLNLHIVSTTAVTYAILPYNLPFTTFAFGLINMFLPNTAANVISLQNCVMDHLRNDNNIANFICQHRDALPSNLNDAQAIDHVITSTIAASVQSINAPFRWNIHITPPTQHPHWYQEWLALLPSTIIHPQGGLATRAPNMQCKRCLSNDHTNTACPFPNIPNWYGPMPQVIAATATTNNWGGNSTRGGRGRNRARGMRGGRSVRGGFRSNRGGNPGF